MRIKSSVFNLVAFAALGLLPIGARALDAATSRLSIIRGDDVAVHFEVEIADSHGALRHGLMGRDKLGSRRGMWFDFKDGGPVSMWMKDTLIPLDMLFADEKGIVVFLRVHTVPMSLERITAPVPVRYVLELNAGDIQTYQLSVGDRVMIPGN